VRLLMAETCDVKSLETAYPAARGPDFRYGGPVVNPPVSRNLGESTFFRDFPSGSGPCRVDELLFEFIVKR